MAAIYSARLAQYTQIGAGSSTLYTAPSGIVAIGRSIQVIHFGTTAQSAFLFLEGGQNIFAFTSDVNDEAFNLDARIVLNPGDAFGFATTGDDWTITISGYLLSS
jgi:hypothetical protein